MVTLHIEHPITDFGTWTAAFDRFAERRRAAGVTGARVYRPVDHPHVVVVELDLPDVDRAREFLDFLQQRVWAVPANSPALAGSPQAQILVIEGVGT